VKYLLVFFGVALADVFWTLYIVWAGERRKFLAGFASACVIGTGAYVTIEYVNDPQMIIPACLGAFAGTVWVLWLRD